MGEISSNWPNDLLGINDYKTLEYYLQSLFTIKQWTNITLVISKWGTLSPYFSLVILLLVLPTNFIVSGVKGSR